MDTGIFTKNIIKKLLNYIKFKKKSQRIEYDQVNKLTAHNEAIALINIQQNKFIT